MNTTILDAKLDYIDTITYPVVQEPASNKE